MDIEKFRAKAPRGNANECWHWTGSLNNKGYGMFYTGEDKNKKLAHRIAYKLDKGDIPDGAIIMHTCDNPPCVNPAHLVAGTMRDNTRDMMAKGRNRFIPSGKPPPRHIGESHPNASITFEQARAIHQMIAVGIKRSEIMRALGVSVHTVKAIRRGNTWREAALDAG